MKATPKFYARPEKAPMVEVAPVLATIHITRVGKTPGSLVESEPGVLLRLMAMGDDNGELHIRMSNFEALSLAAEIVLKVARRNGS